MKSGTTSLFHYLQAHPQAHMSPRKEVEFFVKEKNWRRGFDWYQARGSPAGVPGRLFDRRGLRGVHQVSGVQGRSPERIAQHLPDVRLIYVVRDPIERIRSHYQHRVLSAPNANRWSAQSRRTTDT
jgi:hypothetical protein